MLCAIIFTGNIGPHKLFHSAKHYRVTIVHLVHYFTPLSQVSKGSQVLHIFNFCKNIIHIIHNTPLTCAGPSQSRQTVSRGGP